MPGFNTHYFFGNNTLQLINAPTVSHCCRKHPTVFSLGLQGPDVFFYFIVTGLFHKKNLGSLLHVKETNVFFRNMYSEIEKINNPKKQEIAVAYLAGFLGHHILDANAHPFIYARTNYQKKEGAYFGRHVLLETDIDNHILRKYTGLQPSSFRQDRAIRMNQKELTVVSELLHETILQTYPHVRSNPFVLRCVLCAMPVGCFVLRDKSGRKKAWIRKLESFCPGYPIVSPLIPSDTLHFYKDPFNKAHDYWVNPWDPSLISTESFFDRYAAAEKEYRKILETLNFVLQGETNPKTLFARIGNRSYHSGLDCSIDS